MPIYDYECETCGFCFERKQKFDEEPISVCLRCGEKARRVINSVPIIFKGSGFHITDHRKDGGGESGGSKKGLPDKKEKEKDPI